VRNEEVARGQLSMWERMAAQCQVEKGRGRGGGDFFQGFVGQGAHKHAHIYLVHA